MAESSVLAVGTESMAGWLIPLSLSPVPIHLPVACSHSSGNGDGRVTSLGRGCSRGRISHSFAICMGTVGKAELKREELKPSEFSFSKGEEEM